MDERVSSVRANLGDSSADLADLGSEIAAQLDRAREAEARIARVRARLVAGEEPRFRQVHQKNQRVRPIMIASSLALAATVVLGVGYAATHLKSTSPVATNGRNLPGASTATSTAPMTFTVSSETGTTGGFIAAAKEETPVKFSDGSELRLAKAAHARVTETAQNGAHVLLEDGSMHVSVVHREDTRWAIEAGPYQVRVTGTKFVVAWDSAKNGLLVRMEEGSVVVGGCGLDQGKRLRAGEELVVSCDKDEPSVVPSAVPSSTPTPAPKTTAKPVDPTRSIIALAKAGQNHEAIDAAEANGWDNTLGSLSGGELVLIANSGRYAGRFELATAALETARRRFPDTDSAATAAFELGRIAMDIKHQLKPAGDDFELYLSERPSGPLAREAMGRAIEARNGSGDHDRAQLLAVRYLQSWPDGPHAALARKVNGDKR